MALQSNNLVMIGLGSMGNTPPNTIQPPLVDGVHLRWTFDRGRGYPWYGFYLFRRAHTSPAPKNLSQHIGPQAPGNTNNPQFDTAFGRISSDAPIVFAELNAPAGQSEISLGSIANPPAARTYLKFAFAGGMEARWVQVKIGFKAGGSTSNNSIGVAGLAGAEGQEVQVAQATATYQSNATVTVTMEADNITAIRLTSAALAYLVDISFIPVAEDATTGWQAISGVPYPLRLPLTYPSYPATPNAAENIAAARTTAGNRIKYGPAGAFTPAPTVVYSQGSVTLKAGSPIVTGTNTSWSQQAVGGRVLQVAGDPSVYMISAVEGPAKLRLSRPYGGANGVKSYAIQEDPFGALYDQMAALVAGGSAAGPMVSRFLPTPLTITGTASITKGSANVIGIGTAWTKDLEGSSLQMVVASSGSVTVFNNSREVLGAGTNWKSHMDRGTLTLAGDPVPYRVIRINSPFHLTLDRPYAGASAANKTYTLTERARYKVKTVVSSTLITLDRPYKGASQATGKYRISEGFFSSDSKGKAPTMQRQYPLDLTLLGSMHPAIAQMLGLYWVDQTVPTPSPTDNRTYDYLIVADYTGEYSTAAGLGPGTPADPAKIIAQIASKGFAGVEGYVVFNKKKTATPQLPAPSNVAAYALPDNAGWDTGSGVGGSSSVGLRWDLGVTGINSLLPDRPIAYHVWRAGYGANKPSVQAAPGQYQLITAKSGSGGQTLLPVLVSESLIVQQPAAQGAPVPPPDWPPFGLYTLDNRLADGWYGYQVSGIDLFGRHSPNSGAAQWLQWGPAPTPRPWYYKDPAGTATIHAFAVGALDKVPPPQPTGVEAYALDPADPFVVRDAAYAAWFAAMTPAQQSSVIGLRVQWRWTADHMAQAPDTKEFRIYYNPDSAVPANHSKGANWQSRYYVVGYNEHVTVTTDEKGRPVRLYTVLLPASYSLPLNPTKASPIVYANIGVSAADNKAHTADQPKWNGTPWGGRTGNEGAMAAPAKIVRVLRTPPPPPPTPASDSENAYASKADYHGRSFYSYRWLPVQHLKTHVLRAMDESLFQFDWKHRRAQPNHKRPALSAGDTAFFPPEWLAIANKCNTVANELNALNNTLAAFADTPAGREQAWAAYRGLGNDALRVLAGLPGNEKAFVQLTTQPLDPTNPDTNDRRGPDDPEGYAQNATLRVYLDTLDGRASNRYLYRALSVDGAHNRSALSLATPPVWLPDVVPPLAPVITKAVGGDRQATLSWASNREPDLAAYRVYRTGASENARDLRLMELVGTIAEPNPANARPATVGWTDGPLAGPATYSYRVVAVDAAGNPSAPSKAVAARAYDETPPAVPPLTIGWAGANGAPAVAVSWNGADEARLQRRTADMDIWQNASEWLPAGPQNLSDPVSDLFENSGSQTFVYRLRMRKANGSIAIGAPSMLPAIE